MRTPRNVPPFFNHIAVIVSFRSEEKMIGIATGRIIAFMEYKKVRWIQTDK